MKTNDINTATEHILTQRNYPRQEAYFVAALEDVFAHFGNIPDAAKALLCDYFRVTNWPQAQVDELFHKASSNVRSVKVCEGPCCKEAGSDQLAEALSEALAVKGDHRVERVHCMGSCQRAPAAMVNEMLIANATVSKIEQQL